eukprot:scaffold19637_cov48-Phaeocystis_antarctica.AAC.1
MRTFPTGIPPASRAWTTCSMCAPPRALPPICSRATTARWTPSPPSAGPHPHSASHTPFLLSAVRVGVQPATELRHLQRHDHERHVLRALLPVPCSQSAVEPSPLHAACPAVARRPPASGPHLAPQHMPSFRLSAGRDGVQPAAELRHLQRHEHAVHVLRALRPMPCPQSAVEPSPARRLRRGRPPFHHPGRTSPSTACPPFDSRQSASAFNQPLSFDTSSVTDMLNMFTVRSSPCPAPNLQSSPPLRAACTAVAPRPLTPHRMHALLSTRQGSSGWLI